MLKNRQTILFFGDALMLGIALAVMLVIRFDLSTQSVLITAQRNIFIVFFILWLVVFFIFDLYNLRRVNPNPRNIGLMVGAMILNIGLAILLLYLFPQSGITPKTNLLIVASVGLVLLVVWRRSFYHLFTARIPQRIGIIGQGPLIDELRKEIIEHAELGVVVRHWTSESQAHNDTVVIDTLIADNVPAQTLIALAEKFDAEPLSLVQAYQTMFAKIPVSLMTNEYALAMVSNEQHRGITFLYRIFEILIATFVLAIASPFVLIAMSAILIEDGKPVIIKQKRVGHRRKIFTIYKLRSMRALAPDGSAEIAGAQWSGKEDTRITKVGKIIRKLHIDEVPQMWNIIVGDIALIGPRPERPELVATLEQEIPYYFLRHSIKPGFTGWAQIKFRYARSILDSKEKFEYDLYYLTNKSPLLDIGIVLKTAQIIFTH